MLLLHFRHKGLKRLYEGGQSKGVPAALTEKLLRLLFAMETAETINQLDRFPGWKLHPLKGELKGFGL
jgi:proteic killer suppression protein